MFAGLPFAAQAAIDQPSGPAGSIGVENLIWLVVLSCAVGWVTREVVQSTGRYTPEEEAMFTGTAALIGGPILTWLFFF
ncbi:hypothetical protein [Delftia lacustris]|nr:hypothetical protein [Delftia lacustris]